jgi:hypothetical protein
MKEWTNLLKYMRQEIPDEPACHGCMGINLAAKVQEIIAAHPSTATGHKKAEKAINILLKGVLPNTKTGGRQPSELTSDVTREQE